MSLQIENWVQVPSKCSHVLNSVMHGFQKKECEDELDEGDIKTN